MPNIAKLHHIVPKALLALFTEERRGDGRLWIADLSRHKQWPSTPEKTGRERDYYALQVGGVSPDYFENEILAEIEGLGMPIINGIVDSRKMPETPREYEALMLFLSILATRVPAARSMVDNTVDSISRVQFKFMTSSPERWATHQDEMRRDGASEEDIMPYDEAKEIANGKRVKFRATQHTHLGFILENAETILPHLINRKWVVLVSGSGSIICSDRPLTLQFDRTMPPGLVPGFALLNTEVVVPLSRHVALFGVWDSGIDSRDLNRKQVATLNWRIARAATKYLFSATREFPFVGKSGYVEHDPSGLFRTTDA